MAGIGPGNILIRIGAEGAQAITEIERVNASMATSATRSERMGAALKKAAIPAAIALGAIAVGAKHAIDAASDLQKQVEKTNKVFGASASEVEHWSRGLAESFGLSSDEALKAANKFGNMFENLGYAEPASAKMSKQMVQLAADLASFNNVPVDQVFAALQAGIGGATRGLKKFGIIIDANALKLKAQQMGLYSGKGALDAHAKSAATMALILEQTGKAQGDFARHSTDAANAQKVQAAEAANLSEELGKGLLPYYQEGQKLLIALTKETAAHTTVVKVSIGVVAALASAILLANVGMKAYRAGVILVTAAQWLWNAALSANPIGIVIVAIAAFGAALVIAYNKSATFRAIVQGALAGVLVAVHALGAGFTAAWHAAQAAFDWIVAHWRLGLFAFGPIGAALYVVIDHFQQIRSAAVSAFGAAGDAVRAFVAVFDRLRTLGAGALQPIIGAAHALEDALQAVIGAVKTLIGWLGKIHVPSINLPHIPGIHMAGGLLAPAPAGASELARAGGGTPGVGARAVLPGYAGAGITVNFYGPTDPEGAARAINRVLRKHDSRQGRT